jgi:hypothetical protein
MDAARQEVLITAACTRSLIGGQVNTPILRASSTKHQHKLNSNLYVHALINTPYNKSKSDMALSWSLAGHKERFGLRMAYITLHSFYGQACARNHAS